MELIRAENMTTLRNSDVESRQLLVKGNSGSTRLTITRVTMVAGAVNPRHRHERSEQVWILLCGEATLLLPDGQTDVLRAGDVVRFAENDIHGLQNCGTTPVEYIAVTSPPVDFTKSYVQDWAHAVRDSKT